MQKYVNRNKHTEKIDHIDTVLLFYPLSFMRGGLYHQTIGNQLYSYSEGDYWQNFKDSSTSNPTFMQFYNLRLYAQYSYPGGYGMSLRCLAR